MATLKVYTGWPIPENYRIEKIRTYWTKPTAEIGYVAYHVYNDGDESQLGTYHTIFGALFSTWDSVRLMKRIERDHLEGK